MSAGFVHLNVHTEYSLVDSVIRIKPLMQAVAAADMPAVALTDQSNLFALVKFYRAALNAGLKPIIGVHAQFYAGEATPAHRATLFCQNETGYRNLTRLISRGYTEGQVRGMPLMRYEWLAGNTDGLLALTGGRHGQIGRLLAGNKLAEAETALLEWQQHFPNRLYIELQRTGREGEETYIQDVLPLAVKHAVPVVATNDARFLNADEFDAHEARVCIHEGRTLNDPRRPKNYTAEQYLRTPAEMASVFADLPEALQNSVEIAKRCNLTLTLDKPVLPDFPVPAGETIISHLRHESEQGLATRLKTILDETAPDYADKVQEYQARLDREIGVIDGMGFPGYFLIVADFIQWAKQNNIPVGPGRGSGAGSLVAYCLGITDLDPLAYDLLFERFLNPERVSMPDFDVDFCMEGRDRVIDYVAQRYGRDHVSQIITYGTMAARAVVRDVGRVLGHSYGFVDRIAKMVPFELGMTLTKALEENDELKTLADTDEEVGALITLARALEGLARNAGKHAGGVVIGPSALTDFCPLYCEEGSTQIVTQLDKDDVESIGLVKFDFLGLRTLTIIDWAVKEVNRLLEKQQQPLLDVNALPLDNGDAYALMQREQTTAVFQLESRGMKNLIGKLRPDNFEDIVALVALFRPGPLQSGMVDDFIERKHGANVSYPHPDYNLPALEPVLRPTYGIILYQEQVMQIAQVLAGYSLGSADLLRRAMGKKKPEEMAKQREIFVKGALENGLDNDTATFIFDLMEKFAGYGFNKSHSAAYALLSYQTAWLKAHYPAAFMAAVLSADMQNTDKVVMLLDDCKKALGLEILPPDVNRSVFAFTVLSDQQILYGLGAIKGVGEAAIDGMAAERQTNGPFKDLHELCRRVGTSKLNRRALETLICTGAMDALGPNRATLMAQLPDAVKMAEQHAAASSAGQNDLFGLGGDDAPADVLVATPTQPDWHDRERLAHEKRTLGLYLTGHPIEEHRAELRHFTSGEIQAQVEKIKPNPGGSGFRRQRGTAAVIAGLITALRVKNNNGYIKLDDGTARVEVALFNETFQEYRHLLLKDHLVIVDGSLAHDDFLNEPLLRAERVYVLDDARASRARHLAINWQVRAGQSDFVPDLQRILQPFVAPASADTCKVLINYQAAARTARFHLGDAWQIKPSDELLSRLQQYLGKGAAEFCY